MALVLTASFVRLLKSVSLERLRNRDSDGMMLVTSRRVAVRLMTSRRITVRLMTSRRIKVRLMMSRRIAKQLMTSRRTGARCVQQSITWDEIGCVPLSYTQCLLVMLPLLGKFPSKKQS